jgi:hypothetical protein
LQASEQQPTRRRRAAGIGTEAVTEPHQLSDARADMNAGLSPVWRAAPAPRQPKVLAGSDDGRRPTRRLSIYRLICRPALAEIVGDGRPWTVLMISLLSMPWR